MEEERILMEEGSVDDLTHPPSDETQRQEIYRDDNIIVAVLDNKGDGGAHHLYETYKNKGQYRALTRDTFSEGTGSQGRYHRHNQRGRISEGSASAGMFPSG